MPRNNIGFRLEFKTNKVAEKKGEVMVYSVISNEKWWGDETTAADFDKALKDLGDVDEITVRINSPGGEVSSAIAMRTALMKHKARKTIDIEGQCCSAATLIACLPGARVRMAKGSDYMIHRCSLGVRGNVNVIRSAMESMINTDNAIADIYAEKTGKRDREGYLQLMDKTEWYDVEGAIAEGFADEVIEAEEGEEPIAACAVDEETYKAMCAIYDNVPELKVARQGGFPVTPLTPSECRSLSGSENEEKEMTGNHPVSNVKTAVAAGNTSENMGKTPKQGGTVHMEINGATAEMIQQENPEAAQAIANAAREAALTAERERIARIRKLTDKGAKWEAMRDQAIEDGTSAEAYLEAVIAEKEKERQQAGQAFIASRTAETAPAAQIGAGDAGDLDGKNDKDAEDKLAKELADLASAIDIQTNEMA